MMVDAVTPPIAAPAEGTLPPDALTPAAPGLFSGVSLQQPANSQPTNDDQIDRTARLAAFADPKTNPNDPTKDGIGVMEQTANEYRAQIKSAGDADIRTNFAAQQQQDQVEALSRVVAQNRMSDNPQDRSMAVGASVALQQTLAVGVEQRREYALEQAAVQKMQDLAATGNTTQAQIYANTLADGGPEKVITDINTKYMILQREIQAADVAKEHQPWFASAADFVISNIPFVRNIEEINNVDMDKTAKGWGDWLLGGKNVANQADSLWQLPLDQFAKALRDHVLPKLDQSSKFLSFYSNSQKLDMLTNLQLGHVPTPNQTNIVNGLDNFGLLLGNEKVLSKITAIPSFLVRNGARAEGSNLVADKLATMLTDGTLASTARTGVTTDEAVSESLHSLVNPNPVSTRVPLATDVQIALDTRTALMSRLPSLLQPGRFVSSDEFNAAVEGTKNQVTRELGQPIKDVRKMERRLDNGSIIHGLELTMGKDDTGGWASASAAATNAASKGYPEAEVIKDASGEHFWRFTKDIPETSFYTADASAKATNLFDRYVRNAREGGNTALANMAQVSGNTRSKIIATLEQNYKPALMALTNNEKQNFEQIINFGKSNKLWMDPEQLDTAYQRAFNRSPSIKEINAYQAYRDISDTAHRLRNADELLNGIVKGRETVSLDMGGAGKIARANAIVDRTLSHLPDTNLPNSKPVYNATDQVLHDTNNPMSAAERDRVSKSGYVHLSLQEPITLGDGTTVDSILTKGKDMNVEPLREDQLPYSPGGSRIYEDKYFVKQAATGVQPNTGGRFLKNPNTYVAGSKAQMDWWARKMEEMRLAHNGGATEAQLDNISNGHAGLPTGKEFMDGVTSGHFSPDHPFESLYDRVNPTAYQNKGNLGLPKFGAESEAALTAMDRTQGRLFYGSKGDTLPDWLGNAAKTLDPYETVNANLRSIASLSSFSDFKISAINHWANTYKGVLEELPAGTSPLKYLDVGVAKRGESPAVVNGMETQRDIIKRVLGWKTPFDMQAEAHARTLYEFIEGSDPFSMRASIGNKLVNWTANSNPVQALRGMAYDMTLGMFNVARLPIHAMQMTSAMAIDPVNGFNAFKSLPLLRAYLTKSGSENMLDLMVKRGADKWGGFASADDFKSYMRSAKDSGFFDINSTHSFMNAGYNPNAAIGSFGRTMDRVKEAGRWFSDEGIRLNQSVGWHVAWKQVAAASPDLAKDSPEFLTQVAGKAEGLTQSMSGTSEAYWQKGVLSIPTQFWGYNARMLEMLAGKEFTVPQKLRLAMAQTLLYGSAGLPVVPYLTERLNAHNASAPSIDTFMGTAERGLVDKFVYSTTGADLDIGKRMGSGSWMTDTVRDMLGKGQYGEKSTFDMMGGITGSTAIHLGEQFMNIGKYAAAQGGGGDTSALTLDAIKQAAESVSSIGQAHKAWMIFNYGILVSNKGTVVGDNIPSQAAFGAMLGFEPGQMDNLSAMAEHRQDRAQEVNDLAKVLTNYHEQYANQPDKAQDYIDRMTVLGKITKPDILRDAIRKSSQSDKFKSLTDQISHSIERERQLDEQEQEQEQDQQ